MQNQLLHYYQKELSYIQQLMAEFSQQHPKVASRLRLGQSGSDDPAVARLLESFAFLAAGVRERLEDDIPEINHALLEILAPHLMASVPAMSIAQIDFDPQALMEVKHIPARQMLTVKNPQNEECFFQTCYPVNLAPVVLQHAQIYSQPVPAPTISLFALCQSVLRLQLTCTQPQFNFADIALDNLRFFIQADKSLANALYENLFAHTLDVVIASDAQDKNFIRLGKDALRAVGFSADENLMPYARHVEMPYRYLYEYFALPEKFLFFEIPGLQKVLVEKFNQPGEKLEIFIYFSSKTANLENKISAKNFLLNCTPIVNLFSKKMETFYLNEDENCYQITDRQTSLTHHEIYQIEEMKIFSHAGESINCRKFSGVNAHGQQSDTLYFHTIRKHHWRSFEDISSGYDVFFQLVHANGEVFNQKNTEVEVSVLCTNRSATNSLIQQKDSLNLQMVEKEEPVTEINLVRELTAPYWPSLYPKRILEFISHLNPNFLALNNDDKSMDTLRAILQLYDFSENQNTEKFLQGFTRLKSRFKTARCTENNGMILWHGTEIKITVKEENFIDKNLFLFGCILENFLSLYSEHHTFTQLVFVNEEGDEKFRWEVRE